MPDVANTTELAAVNDAKDGDIRKVTGDKEYQYDAQATSGDVEATGMGVGYWQGFTGGGAGANAYKTGVVPSGTKNGVNAIFTLPGADEYVSNSLAVYLNGLQYNKANISEDSSTQFTIGGGETLPDDTKNDVFTISYTPA